MHLSKSKMELHKEMNKYKETRELSGLSHQPWLKPKPSLQSPSTLSFKHHSLPFLTLDKNFLKWQT